MTGNEILGFRSIAITWKQISVTINNEHTQVTSNRSQILKL